MNFTTLQEKLTIKDNQISLSHGILDKNFDQFLTNYYKDETSIVISGANYGEGHGDNDTAVITGRSSYLNAPNLDITATFTLSDKGKVQAIFKYLLRDDKPGPNDWFFSRSFSGLPKVMNYSTKVDEEALIKAETDEEAEEIRMKGQKPYLDSLNLLNSFFIVSTHDTIELDFHVPLTTGINFVSHWKPSGALGILEGAMKHPYLSLYGKINLPLVDIETMALQPLEYVWDREDVPGIHLQASLDEEIKLGGMAFKDAFYRIYSPHSDEWQKKNSTFDPKMGYTGCLSIASADIEIDLAANMEWNAWSTFMWAECQGMTLGKLEHMMDFAGTSGLHSHLPSELIKAVNALNTLALERISMELSVDDKLPIVEMASFTVGFPNLKWKVWGNKFVVDRLSCRFEIEDPLGELSKIDDTQETSISVMLQGEMKIEGVRVSIKADSKDKFTVYAFMEDQANIPLSRLLKNHAPDAPHIGNLTVDSMAATIAPGHLYAFSAILASKPKAWQVRLGRTNFTISDVCMNLSIPSKGDTTGAFSGNLAFSKDLSFNINYEHPGSFMLRGVFPKCNVGHILKQLTNDKNPMLKGVDIEFDYSLLVIEGKGDLSRFKFLTELDGVGYFGMEIRKTGNTWGAAFGIDINEGSDVSKLHGGKSFAKFLKMLKLKKMMMVQASFSDPTFQFPDSAQFNSPLPVAKHVSLPSYSNGIAQGSNLFCEWEIDTSSAVQKMLSKFLKLKGTIGVTIQEITTNPLDPITKMYTAMNVSINGHPLTCRFGFMESTESGFSAFMEGTLTTHIQGRYQQFAVTTVFVPNGAFISGSMTQVLKFGHLQISDVALELGISAEGLPTLGVAGTIDVDKFESSVAIFFNSADPAQSLLAGAVSDLTAADIVDTFILHRSSSPLDPVLKHVGVQGTHEFFIDGKLAGEIEKMQYDTLCSQFQSRGGMTIPSSSTLLHVITKKKSRAWNITDLNTMRHYQLRKNGNKIKVSVEAQFYFCGADMYVGKIMFRQGFYINGKINFFGLHASATVNMSAGQGIEIEGELDKISLLNDNFFSMKAAKGKGGAIVSASTFTRPQEKNPLLRKPHFYATGSLHLMGLSFSTYAAISEKGAEFDVKGHLVPGVYFDLYGKFGAHFLDVGGSVKVGIGKIDLGALGKIKINTDIDGKIDIQLKNKKVVATVEAEFEALGHKHRIGKTHLKVKKKGLANVGKLLEHEAKKILNDFSKELDKVGKEISKDGKVVVKDVGKAAQTVGKGVSSAANDVGKTTVKTVNNVAKSFKKIFKF